MFSTLDVVHAKMREAQQVLKPLDMELEAISLCSIYPVKRPRSHRGLRQS